MIVEDALVKQKGKMQAADLWMYFYQRSYSPKRSGWYKFYPPTVGNDIYYSGMHRRPGKKIVVELEARFPNQLKTAESEYDRLNLKLHFEHFSFLIL